jgi:16S rRNA (guanine1207-N2)-methyltransferase
MSSGHYFDADPAIPSRPSDVVLSLPDFRAVLQVDRGVFSAGAVDAGTVQLLKTAAAPPPAGDLLDLGCGYGPIACTLAHRAPRATVWAVDVNSRALELTVANARALGLPAVRAVRPDDVPPEVCFAGIWSNPPIRVGKPALQEMLSAWLPRLTDSGQAWLVAHRHLGGDSLAAWLAGQGWSVERVASKKGYRILRVSRG